MPTNTYINIHSDGTTKNFLSYVFPDQLAHKQKTKPKQANFDFGRNDFSVINLNKHFAAFSLQDQMTYNLKSMFIVFAYMLCIWSFH